MGDPRGRDEVTLVDTGWPRDRGRLLASLERIGRSPSDVVALVLTHGHRDHLGSADWFRRQYDVPGRPVCIQTPGHTEVVVSGHGPPYFGTPADAVAEALAYRRARTG